MIPIYGVGGSARGRWSPVRQRAAGVADRGALHRGTSITSRPIPSGCQPHHHVTPLPFAITPALVIETAVCGILWWGFVRRSATEVSGLERTTRPRVEPRLNREGASVDSVEVPFPAPSCSVLQLQQTPQEGGETARDGAVAAMAEDAGGWHLQLACGAGARGGGLAGGGHHRATEASGGGVIRRSWRPSSRMVLQLTLQSQGRRL